MHETWKAKQEKPDWGTFCANPEEHGQGAAWERLTNAARVAYVMLKAECNHAGQNEVKLPYSDIRKIMKTDTFARSIRQLEGLGFIEITQHGGLYRRTNTYKFIEDWRKIK